jgi:predicted MPP superfamily phosphohydrolase
VDDDILEQLERRVGRLYSRQRLGIEAEREAQSQSPGLKFFQRESWYSAHSVIRTALKVTGLWGRACRNAAQVRIKHNEIRSASLPASFDGYTILHLSDLHVDMSEPAMQHLIGLTADLHYDICVLTGDFRGLTYGPYEAALHGMTRVRDHITGPIYGVLGNHDSIRMLPGLEAMGIRMLLNECATIMRGDQRIWLAGVDDAHSFRLDNIEKAAADIPEGDYSILLSHTPEIYRQAAHAGFNLMFAGHTHGGQLCLPGSVPITLDATLPRRMGAGAWRHYGMEGYTSVGAGTSMVAVRLNCPPEITLHHLRRG